MSTLHLTPDQRIALAQKGAEASARKARETRLKKWITELGVDPVVGQQIYDAGYQCAYQQRRRKEHREARA